MKIKYEFATETVEIEVSDVWGEYLIDLDRQEYNIDHKETRRHCSLEALNPDDAYLPSEVDVLADVLRNTEAQRLYKAISQLEPQQQELVKAIYFDGIPIVEYARMCGTSQPAISRRKDRVLKKLKKLLE